MTRSPQRAHAALWREIADATWSAYRLALREGLDTLTLARALSIANQATKLAHRLEHAGGEEEAV